MVSGEPGLYLEWLFGPGDENYLLLFGCTAPMRCENGLGKVWWHLGYILCLCVCLYRSFFLAALTKLGSTQLLGPCLPCHSSSTHCMLPPK